MTTRSRRHVARRPDPLVHPPRHRRRLGLAAVCAVSAAALSACATPQQILAPIADVPETCTAIDAELIHLATAQGHWQSLGAAKDSLALGVSVAAVGGLLPAGFAWAPLAAMVVPQIALPSHHPRIAHLAQAREIRRCQPLNPGD